MRSAQLRPTARPQVAGAATVGAVGLAVLAALAAAPAQGSGPSDSASSQPALVIEQSRQPEQAQPAERAQQARLPRNIKLVQTRKSLLGQHKWYRQVAGGHFVVGGWYGTHWNKFTRQFTVWDGRRRVGKVTGGRPVISAGRASVLAAHTTKTTVRNVTKTGLWVLGPTRRNSTARLAYAISSADGRGARTTYVDATSGAVLKTILDAHEARRERRVSVTGTGRVFAPNPVVKLQDETLTDQRDAADAVPPGGYSRRALPRLNGSHELAGRFVRIVDSDRAQSHTNTYLFNRANPYFEQTNAYYAVDKEQEFLQTIGFIDVNLEAQRVETNAFPDDNSYYEDRTDLISLGRGGVDDAEDPEVVWHEYGHAIQADQVVDFGWGRQSAAIGEGFGDYMAVTMSQGRKLYGTRLTPAACVMDWDATSYAPGPTHCLRRTDTDKVYPDDLSPDPHLGGEIWSRGLWDMNRSMGRDDATRVIVESDFWMYPTIRMPDASKIMVSVAKQLVRNGLISTGSVKKVRAALLARHLLPS